MAADNIEALIQAHALPAGFAHEVERVWRPMATRITERRAEVSGTMVVGLCGPQGSGKSTAVETLEILLTRQGWRAARLSIDDLYLRKAERAVLAASVHPLLATRGPPGSHDVPLGLRVMDALATPGPHALPRFDKATDDRRPEADWPMVQGPLDIVLFEGWCVGARTQPDAALDTPVNALEAEEDSDGTWRRYVNDRLALDYPALFGRIDYLIQLRPPAFEVVVGWRQEQERKLRAAEPGRGMSDGEVVRFVQYYERLSRWIDTEMPGRADVVLQLDGARRATLA